MRTYCIAWERRGEKAQSVCGTYIKVILKLHSNIQSVQSLSRVRLFATPRTAAHRASLSITNSQSLLKLMFIESVMPSNHLILCCPLLLPPSIFPSIRVFSNESVLIKELAKVLKCHPNYWETRFKILTSWIKFSSAQFGHSVVSDSL